jgi:hypothetical protein
MTALLELVFEGGEILDHSLAFQRESLRERLGSDFVSVDLRSKTALERKALLQTTLVRGKTFKNVLIRGLSGLLEASQVFRTSSLFLDALGRSELPASREFSQWAFRTKRAFVYSDLMMQAVRAAGIGAISRHQGPYLPRINLGTEDVSNSIGVLSLGRGFTPVLGQLKRRWEQEGLKFDLVTTMAVAGATRVGSVFEVAERCGLLIAPYEEMDRGGPHEAALLALSTGRVLCTSATSALYSLPMGEKQLLQAACYERNSYADAALDYEGIEVHSKNWKDPYADNDALSVPDEILRRL